MTVGRVTTLREYKERVLRVLVHVQQHLDDPLDLKRLARIACFSPYHFHRLFKGIVGESLMEYIRRLRLERAAHRLKLGSEQVTEIAFQAGYETHEAFTRAFKNSFGIAPIHYRARHKTIAAPVAPSGIHFSAQQTLRNFRTHRAGGRTMHVSVQTLSPCRVAFTRHVGPYNQVGTTWDRLTTFLGKEGFIRGDAVFIGICHDDPEVTPQDKVRHDACVTVPDSFVPVDDIGIQTIQGGEYAVLTHFGPYTKLGRSYARLLGEWLPRSGREPGPGPCFEVYFNSPEDTAPAELITDIHVPLQPQPVSPR